MVNIFKNKRKMRAEKIKKDMIALLHELAKETGIKNGFIRIDLGCSIVTLPENENTSYCPLAEVKITEETERVWGR